jgi:hypothetical protein
MSQTIGHHVLLPKANGLIFEHGYAEIPADKGDGYVGKVYYRDTTLNGPQELVLGIYMPGRVFSSDLSTCPTMYHGTPVVTSDGRPVCWIAGAALGTRYVQNRTIYEVDLTVGEPWPASEEAGQPSQRSSTPSWNQRPDPRPHDRGAHRQLPR